MPNTKSAKKALRQSLKRKAANLAKKTQIKIATKSYQRLIESGDPEGAKKQLALTYKALDKAAKTGVIAKNKASRLKSKLTKRLTKSK